MNAQQFIGAISVSYWLMIWESTAAGPRNTPENTEVPEGPLTGVSGWTGVGPPPNHLRQIPPNPSAVEKPKLTNNIDYSGDTSNLEWVPLRDEKIPSEAFSIFNDYTSRRDFVCRANDYCTFGFLNEGRGYLCFFPFRGYELQTNNFDVLVNKDNFERLEWKSGSTVSDPGIKFCEENFVGKNEYGLGDVFKGYFYLPWQGKEIWYSSYDVLSINRDPFNVHFSNVTYSIDQVNRTQHLPFTIKTSRVENHGDQEVLETVHMEVTTVKANSWESTFSSSLAQSTSISAGIPDFASGTVSIGAVVTMTLSDGHLESESITQAQDVQVKVPPGYYCVVRMEGRKVEATIPYRGNVIKVYKDSKRLSTTITGVYSGTQTCEINSEVERCQPLTTPSPAVKSVTSEATLVVSSQLQLLCVVFGVFLLVLVLLSALFTQISPFNIRRYFPLNKEVV